MIYIISFLLCVFSLFFSILLKNFPENDFVCMRVIGLVFTHYHRLNSVTHLDLEGNDETMEAKELHRKQKSQGAIHRWVGVGVFSWDIERMTCWLYTQVKSNGVVQLAMMSLLDLLFLDPNCSMNTQTFFYFSKDCFCHPAPQFSCVDEKLGTICAGAAFATDNVQALYAPVKSLSDLSVDGPPWQINPTKLL